MTIENFRNALEKLGVEYRIFACNSKKIVWSVECGNDEEIIFSEYYSNENNDFIVFDSERKTIKKSLDDVINVEFSDYKVLKISFRNKDFWEKDWELVIND